MGPHLNIPQPYQTAPFAGDKNAQTHEPISGRITFTPQHIELDIYELWHLKEEN